MANKYHAAVKDLVEHGSKMRANTVSQEANYERGMKALAGTKSKTTAWFGQKARKFRKAINKK